MKQYRRRSTDELVLMELVTGAAHLPNVSQAGVPESTGA